MGREPRRRRAWPNQMPELGLWQAGSLEASYKRLKAWFNSKRVYMEQPIYPIYNVIVRQDGKDVIVGSSEMLGNVFNVAGLEIQRGAEEVIIRKSDLVVDARLESMRK